MQSFDAIIVGAGVLGSALAATLSKQGRKVLLIERDLAEPDRIVGELLQPGGVEALEKLGLRHCLDGIDAVPEQGYQVIYKDESVAIKYTNRKEISESGGKTYEGRSFHHGRFVMKLRQAARESSYVTIIEATCNSVVANPITHQVLGVAFTRKGQDYTEHVFAPLTFVADGCFSKFRKSFIQKPVTVRSNFVGLLLKDAPLPAPNHGHVVLGKSPVLLYQISKHDTRILVDIPGKLPSAGTGALKRYLVETVLPELPTSLQPSFQTALESPDRLRSMPNSWLPPTMNTTQGIILLGDAMNMRHPLTGGGMTVALNDVLLITSLLHPSRITDFNATDRVLAEMRTFHWQRKSLSSVINVLAQALYSLFAANDEKLWALQEGCFRYFQLGGRCVDDPVGLLSGIVSQPLLLAFHFYAVAVYAIYLLFANARVWQYPQTAVKSLQVLAKACTVFVPVVVSEMMP